MAIGEPEVNPGPSAGCRSGFGFGAVAPGRPFAGMARIMPGPSFEARVRFGSPSIIVEECPRLLARQVAPRGGATAADGECLGQPRGLSRKATKVLRRKARLPAPGSLTPETPT